MTPAQKRKAFQWLKSLSTDKFFAWMNWFHSKAYDAAVRHYEDAMAIELQPKQRARVIERAKRIREEWDGMQEITLEETERLEFERRGSR